jgi:hypothetical protein
MSSIGFSLYVLTFSILWMTSKPCTARPKMVCLLSSQGYDRLACAGGGIESEH